MNPITDLNNLRLFAEVVEHGSFTSAARSLGVQTSKLSRRIRTLEEELGVRLLNRTSRTLSLTETGRQFYQHCAAVVAESVAAKDIVDQTRTTPQGTVRMSCPVALLSSGVAAIIARYVQDNPQVQVLLDATNRRVDVIEDGLDFAIRVRVPPLENTDLAFRQLGVSVQILVASPALIARHPAPSSIESLRNWPTLAMSSNNERFIWNLLDSKGVATSWAHQPRLATDDLDSLRVAAIQGTGVALVPRELVDADIKAGRLQHLLTEMASTPGLVHAIFPSRRGMVPAVRHLLNALVAGFEEMNRQN
jgi:DNA-binding transcriptional LysR family regulator